MFNVFPQFNKATLCTHSNTEDAPQATRVLPHYDMMKTRNTTVDRIAIQS